MQLLKDDSLAQAHKFLHLLFLALTTSKLPSETECEQTALSGCLVAHCSWEIEMQMQFQYKIYCLFWCNFADCLVTFCSWKRKWRYISNCTVLFCCNFSAKTAKYSIYFNIAPKSCSEIDQTVWQNAEAFAMAKSTTENAAKCAAVLQVLLQNCRKTSRNRNAFPFPFPIPNTTSNKKAPWWQFHGPKNSPYLTSLSIITKPSRNFYSKARAETK